MALMLGATAFALALLCAAIMGVAIQRGSTCTVVALDELLRTRRPTRLLAMIEASVWVGGGLLVLHQFALLPQIPAGYEVTRWTLIGAALLGLGAVVNRGCVFGTVSRIGSGEWAHLATPLGFYAGCISMASVFSPPATQGLSSPSPVLGAPSWVAWLFLAFAIVRGVQLLSRVRVSATSAWSPHAATTVIGITFVGLLLLAGAWTYTDVLADVVRGMAQDVSARLSLGLALLLGAIGGGALAGKLRNVPLSLAAAARCFAGGALMGWGSLLIPGGNDGLILLGMPLLRPYAWAAFATMCVAIVLALTLAEQITQRSGAAVTPI
ncbi:YeeE/YedE thiosulfate transporter family protein [soil metagenome]